MSNKLEAKLNEIEKYQIPSLNGPVFSKRGDTMKKLTQALRVLLKANKNFATNLTISEKRHEVDGYDSFYWNKRELIAVENQARQARAEVETIFGLRDREDYGGE